MTHAAAMHRPPGRRALPVVALLAVALGSGVVGMLPAANLGAGVLAAAPRFATAPAATASTASSVPSSASRQVVVTLAPGVPDRDVEAAIAVSGARVVSRIDAIHAVVLDAGSTSARDALVARLRLDPRFSSAETSTVYHAMGVPNDPMLTTEWWLPEIDVQPAWDWPAPASPVTIAIVDSGVDLHNPDLAAILLPGRNFVTPGAPPQDDSAIGHGTHVAGIAAAAVNDGIGMAGVAPWARILPVKILDSNGMADDATAAAGIVWAADQNVRVINLSLEGPASYPCSKALTDAVAYALSRNDVVVSAAGNEGGPVGCPARIPGVISVGAVDQDQAIWPHSNRGPELSLVAPGVSIKSTAPVAMGGYRVLTGTSMASPMVAGAAAILAGVAPGLNGAAIGAALVATATPLGQPGRNDTYGAGLLDVGAAMASVAEPITGVTAAPARIAAAGGGTPDVATFAFHVAVPLTATVAVEKADGTAVASLSTGPLAAGDQSFTWAGTDATGARVPDGAYSFTIRGTASGAVPIAITRPIGVSLALTTASVAPAAISPNGDGKADTATVTYTLRVPATVVVTVRASDGHVIRTIASGPRVAGTFTETWNGRSADGATAPAVPQGAYRVVVSATTDRGTYEMPLDVAVSVTGVAVTGLRTTPVFPVADGYRDTSSITFTRAGSAAATVYVYAPGSTKVVRTLRIPANVAAGPSAVTWDGRDAAGRVMGAGTYRVRVRTVDAAAVARWSAYAPLAVSGMRLVERSTTIALHGGAYDPRTFVSSSAAASVGPSATLPGGVRISADGLGDGAAAFWQVPLPARTLLRSVRATLVTARDATGDSLVGTWRGTSIDRVGWIQGSGGPQAFDIPTSRLPSTARAFALGVEQDGPGTLDVGTVTITVKYAVLQ